VTSASATAHLRTAREHLVQLISRFGGGGLAAAAARPGPDTKEFDWTFAAGVA
jgi:hypothetical protein